MTKNQQTESKQKDNYYSGTLTLNPQCLTLTPLLSRSRFPMAVLECASQHDLSRAFVLFNVQRSYIHFRLPPLIVPPWPALTVCDLGQGVVRSPTGSRTQQVRSLLDVLIHCHGQPGFTAYYTAPPAAMVRDV